MASKTVFSPLHGENIWISFKIFKHGNCINNMQLLY